MNLGITVDPVLGGHLLRSLRGQVLEVSPTKHIYFHVLYFLDDGLLGILQMNSAHNNIEVGIFRRSILLLYEEPYHVLHFGHVS